MPIYIIFYIVRVFIFITHFVCFFYEFFNQKIKIKKILKIKYNVIFDLNAQYTL